jgi:ATP/maltotriose-dependent transcriptional regulator MalT/DNA-binding SARP family transcriptional activator
MSGSRSTPAKITPPRLRRVYQRTRLLRSLERASCIWIGAPPGAGKTTLGASYLQNRGYSSIWYQIDEGDTDPATFFYYMRLAAMRNAPRAAHRLRLFTQEHAQTLSVFSRRYFEQLFGSQRDPFVLVLDNYQELPADAALHEVVAIAVDELPRRARLFVLSREPPPPQFARLNANGSLLEIDWQAIRLDSREVRGIVRLRRPEIRSTRVLKELEARCDGWAAGLVLLLEGRADVEAGARLPTGHARDVLFDYFSSEVFEQQSSGAQRMLGQIALLPKATARMAVAMTGNRRAERLLRRLHDANFFTQRHAQSPFYYQFHPLFREFLLNRLGRQCSATRLSRLKQRAARLLETTDQPETAVALHIETENWAEATALICRLAAALLAQGRGALLEEWVEQLPPMAVDETPWLSYWLGCHRQFIDQPRARDALAAAYRKFAAGHDRSGLLLSWAGVVDTYLLEWHDFHALTDWIAEGERLRRRQLPHATPQIEARFLSSLCFAVQQRDPRQPRAREIARRVHELVLTSPDLAFRVSAGGHLINFYHYFGDAEKAGQVHEVLQRDLGDESLPVTLRFHALRASFTYYWMRGEPEAGIRPAEAATSLFEEYGLHAFGFTVLTSRLLATLLRGDQTGSRTHVQPLAALTPSKYLDAVYLNWLVGWAAWATGDLPTAEARTALAHANATRAGAPFPLACARLARAVLHLERAQYAEGHAELEKVRETAESMQSGTLEHHCFLLEAMFALAEGDETRSLDALRRGLAAGRSHALPTTYWWDRRRMSRLCALALAAGIEPEYVRVVIRKAGLVPESQGAFVHWPWPIRIYALGGFRLELDGEPVPGTVRGRRKLLELLRLLVTVPEHALSSARAAEWLWPDAEGDAARVALKTTAHRLRTLLGRADAIVLAEGAIRLNRQVCWTDVGAFLELVFHADGKRDESQRLEQALDLYGGELLASEEERAWLLEPRQRLRGALLRAVEQLARHRESRKEWSDAARVYQRGLDVEPLAGSFHLGLARCHLRVGDRARALEVYERFSRRLDDGAAAAPSAALEALARELRGD